MQSEHTYDKIKISIFIRLLNTPLDECDLFILLQYKKNNASMSDKIFRGNKSQIVAKKKKMQTVGHGILTVSKSELEQVCFHVFSFF